MKIRPRGRSVSVAILGTFNPHACVDQIILETMLLVYGKKTTRRKQRVVKGVDE
jgi:hypothetical protein